MRSPKHTARGVGFNIAIGVIILGCSIGMGVYSRSAPIGLMTAVSLFIMRLVIDMRLEVGRQSNAIEELQAREAHPLVASYLAFKDDRCELFRRIALQTFDHTDRFFKDLSNGHFEIHTLDDVHNMLSFLLQDMHTLKSVLATSHGELKEWSGGESWYSRKYFSDHKAAIARGITIKRMFIAGDGERQLVDRAISRNSELGITATWTPESRLSHEDIAEFGNAMIFFGTKTAPFYSLQATHDRDGRFIKAAIHRDPSHVQRVLDALRRIEHACHASAR